MNNNFNIKKSKGYQTNTYIGTLKELEEFVPEEKKSNSPSCTKPSKKSPFQKIEKPAETSVKSQKKYSSQAIKRVARKSAKFQKHSFQKVNKVQEENANSGSSKKRKWIWILLVILLLKFYLISIDVTKHVFSDSHENIDLIYKPVLVLNKKIPALKKAQKFTLDFYLKITKK